MHPFRGGVAFAVSMGRDQQLSADGLDALHHRTTVAAAALSYDILVQEERQAPQYLKAGFAVFYLRCLHHKLALLT